MPKLGAPLDANSLKVKNLATPTANADAATKLYVDNAAFAVPPNILQVMTLASAAIGASGSLSLFAFPATADASSQLVCIISYVMPTGGTSPWTSTNPWTLKSTLNPGGVGATAFDIWTKFSAAGGGGADQAVFTNGAASAVTTAAINLELQGASTTTYGAAAHTNASTINTQYAPQITASKGSLLLFFGNGVIANAQANLIATATGTQGFAVVGVTAYSTNKYGYNLPGTGNTSVWGTVGVPHA